jgi:intracellular septation protein A
MTDLAAPFAPTAPDRPDPQPFEGSSVHPAIHAGKWILADLCSTLLFVGLYALTGSVYLATGLGILAGLSQIAYLKLRRARIDAMQWMSLCLVLLFGAASLLTHDPRFVMLKPCLIYVAIGSVMLKPGWMIRYAPPIALIWSADLIKTFGQAWAGLMFLTSALNLLMVVHGDPRLWAVFIGVFPIASKLLLFAVQYAVTRTVVIARMRAARAPTGD